jgi:hypothetical protein
MSEESYIRMVAGALDDESGDPILRGVLDPATLHRLRVDYYQRERLQDKKILAIAEALTHNRAVPDVQLGMRGGNIDERDGAFYLLDPVYIIDGLQRVSAAVTVVGAGGSPRLGALVHFNTNAQLEHDRFDTLNMTQTRLSPNIMVRNERGRNAAVNLLFQLSQDSSFVLYNRVSWAQIMQRHCLVTGLSFVRVAAILHSSVTPGIGLLDTRHRQLTDALLACLTNFPRKRFRDNVISFWSTINECFKINDIHFVDRAPAIKGNFLFAIARVFAEHTAFWSDGQFFVEKDLRSKIASFPMSDPTITMLCAASGGSARAALYGHIVDFINSGKRTKRLVRIEDKTAMAATA